jgi:hypothetical protein
MRPLNRNIAVLAVILAVILFAACPPPNPNDPAVRWDVTTNARANEYCPDTVVEMRAFPKGQTPTNFCTVHIKPDDPIDPPDPMVNVEVCAESNLVPGEWCVDRKTISVKQSTLPLGNCGIHSPPRVVVYVGVYDLLVAEGDWRAFLRKVKSAGGTGIRIFADCQWNWQGTQPYEHAAYDEETAEKIRYKDPSDPKDIRNVNGIMTLVRESGAQFPLYNYNRLRATYWTRLSEVLNYCRELKLTAWVVFIDYCTLKTPGDMKYYSPWYCAVQRMLPGIQNGVWGEQMRPWFAAFYRNVWDAVRASGVDYLIEDMNEGDALGWDDAFMLSWFTWSNATMRAMGIPKEKIVTTAARNVTAIAPLCGVFSPHGIGRPDQIKTYNGQPAAKTIWSSDGYWGGTGEPDAKGRRGIGLDVAKPIADAILSIGGDKIEFLPRVVYRWNNDKANVDAMTPETYEVIRILARGK